MTVPVYPSQSLTLIFGPLCVPLSSDPLGSFFGADVRCREDLGFYARRPPPLSFGVLVSLMVQTGQSNTDDPCFTFSLETSWSESKGADDVTSELLPILPRRRRSLAPSRPKVGKGSAGSSSCCHGMLFGTFDDVKGDEQEKAESGSAGVSERQRESERR